MLAAQRILLIRLSALGDVLFTLPAVNAVRDHFSGAHLSYLVSDTCAALLEGFVAVDEAIVFDRDAFRHIRPRSWLQSSLNLAICLRRKRFDLVIDFQSFGETAVLGYLSGAPERWGLIEGKKVRRLAYTRVCPLEHVRHPVDMNLRFLAYCGLPTAEVRNEFKLPGHRLEEARGMWASLGLVPERPTIFIQPFTSDPRKNLPLEKLLQFARHCKAQRVQVLFGGGPADRQRLVESLGNEFPTSAGAELLVTAGLMQLSTLVIGGDTGMLHLARALGKRVTMLLNAVAPHISVPYGRSDWTLRPPPGKHVADIPLNELTHAACAALGEQGEPARLN